MYVRSTMLLALFLVAALPGCSPAGGTLPGPGSAVARSTTVAANPMPPVRCMERAHSMIFIRAKVSASNPTLCGGVAYGSASFNADISQGQTETLTAKIYEESNVVATATKTVHGPALPFAVTAKYTCKGTTGSSFHTEAIGKGIFNQKAVSATVTLACN